MAYRYRRRLRWRRKARRMLARRRRYFRRAGVVSKFATPGAVTKLSNLRNGEVHSETELLTKIVEANRCVKIIYRAWHKKDPRMITLSNFIVSQEQSYKTATSSDIIKKMRELNKKIKMLKIQCSLGNNNDLVKSIIGNLQADKLCIATLAKCKNIGQMMMVLSMFVSALGAENFKGEMVNATLNAMITRIIDDVRSVIPYALPVARQNVN